MQLGVLVEVEDVNAERARQVFRLCDVNLRNQAIHRFTFRYRDFLEGFPKRDFKRDACAVASYRNGMFLG